MKEIYSQLKQAQECNPFDMVFCPVSKEDQEKAKSFKYNQMVRQATYGTRKQRSVHQNKWVHAMFRIVADNTEDPEWDTPDKVKRNVKMAMKFFKDDCIVCGNKVYFELRSFAFDKMEHQEANLKYEEAKTICAKFLGVDPADLEAQAVQL